MAEHRVPMLGGALRRRDPERSRDPHIRELVAALATLDVAPAPRADFRAELRAQLVAVTPRLVEEGETSVQTDAKPGAKRAAERAAQRAAQLDAPRRSGFRLAKPLIAAASVMAAFVMLLGGAVLLSRHALPGDTLYGLKRASENTEYGLTGGTVAKGKLKLEFAARRIGEVSSLLPRASALAAGTGVMADSGQLNSHTSALVRTTLGSADSDVQSAAQMLGGAAVRSKSAAPLAAITSWAPGQIAAISAVIARIPAGSLHDRAVSTLSLVTSAQQRAATLKGELGCNCLGSSGTDNLGPIPCATGCSPSTPGSTSPHATPTPSVTRSGSTTTKTHPVVPGHRSTSSGGSGTSSAPPGSTSTPGGPTSKPGLPIATKPTVPGLPTLPGLPGLPGLPTPSRGHAGTSTPTLPISVSSCGLKVGPINIGILC